MDKDFINKVNQIIIQHLGDEKFGVRELASKIGLSRSQLLRRVKSSTGKSVNRLIRELRLKESLNLLKEDKYTASEVSYRVGFASPSYFSKCFHDYFGFPPGEIKFHQEIDLSNNLVRQEKIPISKSKMVVLSIILLAFFVGAYYLIQSINPISIAILPFQNFSEKKDKENLTDVFTEALTLELARRSDLRVPSRTTLMQYKNSEKSCRDIAKEMNVDLVLEGSFQVEGENLSIVAQLIDPFPKEKHVWENRYNLKYEKDENIIPIAEKISTEIATEINLKVENIEDGIKKVNPEAYINYLKGRHLYNQQSSKSVINSIEYLNKSIELDSNFALAYSTLSEAYITWNELRIDSDKKPENRIRGKKAIEKALELDNKSGEILITKGRVLGKFDWDWEGMKLMAEKGLKLDPSNSRGYMLLSEYYAIKGDYVESLNQAHIAVELDPLNSMTGCFLGKQLYIAQQYEEAINQYKKVIELFPNYGFAWDGIGTVYLEKGDKESAIQAWQKLMVIMNNYSMADLYQDEPFGLALQYWLEKAKSNTPQYCSNPTIIAQAHIFVNEKENALEYLEIAYENHDEELPLRLLQPHFSSLRTDSRFQKIANNIGVVFNK